MMEKPQAIEVRSCTTLVVSGVGLQDGDKYLVYRVIDSKRDIREAEDIPFSPNGAVVFLDSTHNPVAITMPGRYRIYPDGVVSDTARLFFDEVYSCPK